MAHRRTDRHRATLASLFVAAALLLPASASTSSAASSTPPGRNGLIAFAANGRYDRSEIALIRADGRGFRVLTRAAGDDSPAWSPRGRRLVFSRGGYLYTIGADGTGLRRLTRGRGSDSDPTWSPDGRRIAFVRDSDALYVINANGSSPHRLPSDAPWIEGLSWSPDGKTIALGAAGRGGGIESEIELIDPERGESLDAGLEGQRDDREPDWSPDGRSLVFQRTTCLCGSCDQPGVWISTTDGAGSREIGRGGTNPSFSPDGKRVVASGEGSGLVVLDLAGRSRTLPGTENATDPAWQPLPR